MNVPNLETSGRRLAVIDTEIMRLVRRRMEVATQVAAFKKVTGDAIFRSDVEDSRLKRIGDLASEIGINPHFARSLLYDLINESCKVQMRWLQGEDGGGPLPEDPDARYQRLKQNLIALTSRIAPEYDTSGGKSYLGTKAYVDFENNMLLKLVDEMPASERKLAIDLGCAVGRVSRLLSPHFDRVAGYDISQDMVDEAWKRAEEFENLAFEQQDLDEGIPLEDGSVDLVIMGLGTASDIRHVNKLMKEVSRVLRRGGRFLFSFYNREALIYTEGYLSFDSSLAAEINADEGCLTVHKPGRSDPDDVDAFIPGEDFLIHAKPYGWEDLECALLATSLKYDSYHTYPTIASVTPGSLLTNETFANKVVELDRAMSHGHSGAYRIVTGHNA